MPRQHQLPSKPGTSPFGSQADPSGKQQARAFLDAPPPGNLHALEQQVSATVQRVPKEL